MHLSLPEIWPERERERTRCISGLHLIIIDPFRDAPTPGVAPSRRRSRAKSEAAGIEDEALFHPAVYPPAPTKH